MIVKKTLLSIVQCSHEEKNTISVWNFSFFQAFEEQEHSRLMSTGASGAATAVPKGNGKTTQNSFFFRLCHINISTTNLLLSLVSR